MVRVWLEGWMQDVRSAARMFVLEPMLAGMIVITLALGIGANAAMFGIIDRLLLSGPDHIVNPDQLQRLYITRNEAEAGPVTGSRFGYVTYRLMRDVPAFESVGAYTRTEEVTGTGAEARQVWVTYATWDLFPTLGVTPALGRFFAQEEDTPPRGNDVLVLSYEYWQSEYGGAPDIIGQSVRFANRPHTIIGVAPRGFTGPELEPTAVWRPMSSRTAPVDNWWESWNAWWIKVVARVKPDVSPQQAGTQATTTFQAAYTGYSQVTRSAELSVRPLGFGDAGTRTTESVVARWLVGVSMTVLLIACANVANLLLARAIRRRRDVAVKLALGISRLRLARLLVTESLLLALAGGIAALVVAYWGGEFIRVVLLPHVHWSAPVLGPRVLGFSILATVTAGLVIGLAPALQATRHGLNPALRTGAREGGVSRGRLRGTLTGVQAALSVVLLVGSGLFVRSLHRINEMDLGIEPDRVLTISPRIPMQRGEEWQAYISRIDNFHVRAVERLKMLPDIEYVAASIGTPFGSSMSEPLAIPGLDSIPGMAGGGPYVQAVTADYHHVAGTRLLRGRYFTPEDGANGPRVAIVNETMARTLWPDRDAIGQCLVLGSGATDCSSVVGIVEDAHHSNLREERAFQYYIPFGQERNIGGPILVARPRAMRAATHDQIAMALREIEPSIGFIDMATLQHRLDPQIRPWKLGATMFTIFGGLALLIAAIGLYSVIAYSVAQRRTELGIRMALGARSGNIIRMVLRQAMILAGAGLLIGILAALAAGRFIQPLLFDVSPRDPITFVGVIGTLLLVAAIAGTVPAARARRVSPSEALRSD